MSSWHRSKYSGVFVRAMSHGDISTHISHVIEDLCKQGPQYIVS